MRKIKLLEDIPDGFEGIFYKDDIIEEDEPYTGFNSDGTFTICFGMGLYIDVQSNQFEEICEK